MYSQLGNIKFQALKGFSSFSSNKATQFSEIPLILGKPALQRTGDALETISASIQLHRDFSDVENDILAFNEAREAGEILPLVLGNGLVRGNYVIESISETHTKTAIDGSLIVASLALTLKEWPLGNELENQQLAAITDGFASDIRKTVPTREVLPPTTDAAEINALQGEIQSNGIVIDESTRKAADVPSLAGQLFKAISEAGQASSVLALEMASKLNQIEFALSNVADLIASANSVATLANNVKTAADSAIIGDVQTANEALKVGNADLFSKSALLASLSACRLV